ncbi:MAG TPA: DMT family transporter, partial [Kiloniellales bacterium]|nr:DMT family transporter [Kiloniellales bacterium]
MPFLRRLSQQFHGLSHAVQGALYMTAAAFFFALMNTCVRFAADAGIHATEIAFFRNLFALTFMLPWLFRTGRVGLRTGRLMQHVWRALVGVVSMFLWFASVAALPMAEAVALNFTFPLFATILAAVILKEDVRLRRWSATVVGFIGVLVILQPWDVSVDWVSALPVAAALVMAISATLVKSLSRTEAPGTMVFYMNLFMTPMALLPAVFFWSWPGWETLGFLGVLVILQPWDVSVDWVSALPVAAALVMAVSATLVKSLSRTESP